MKGFEKPLVIDCRETVSRAASRMVRERKAAALVMDGEDFIGILAARDLVKRKIDNPDKTGIRPFVRSINPVPSGIPVTEMLNSMLINDYKALPVRDPKGLYLVTKLDLLGVVRGERVFRETRARDVMNFPYSVSGSDSLTTARSLIRNLNLSRLPVLGKENRLEGLVDVLGLLGAIITKRRASRGEESGEAIKTDGISIRSLMNRNPPRAGQDQSLRAVIGTMIRQNTPTVMVMDGDSVMGIIAPRDILKLIGREVKGVYVTISGLQEDDVFIRGVVDEEVTNEVRKLGRFITIDSLILHVERHHETGRRVKYSVKGRLVTNRGVFSAGDFAWDVTKAVRGVLQKLERETIRKKERG
jgi:CBS domain-containing protein/ribosome-associated translation inhibitor RaiA